MELSELQQRALAIKQAYSAQNVKQWGTAEYLQGFVGDVGALAKLIMAKEGFRMADEVDEKIEHELADCLWSVLVLADELGVDLESAFNTTMDDLEVKIKTKHADRETL